MKPLISARVSDEVYKWLAATAKKERRSVSDYVFLLLERVMRESMTAKRKAKRATAA